MMIALLSVGAELCSNLPNLSVLWQSLLRCSSFYLEPCGLTPCLPACLEGLFLLLPGLVAAAAAA